MARMALAAWQGGAVGIRANTPDDIRAIRSAVPLPVVGLFEAGEADVYITPTWGMRAPSSRPGPISSRWTLHPVHGPMAVRWVR